MKRISILGSTGSIGTQTLDVAHWQGYEVVGLAAGRNSSLLLQQVAKHKPHIVACHDDVRAEVAPHLPAHTRLVSLDEVAQTEADTVVAAISGIAGLQPTAAALQAGRHVALANKEAMVVAGPLMWELARSAEASITPVDSEHSALFQCLVGEARSTVSQLVLTASGGPFRQAPQDLSHVTPAQALKHPNWDMGAKVTIDSATLFNKGLEVLEAHFLFEFPLDHIAVVVHPQSLVHGLVRFTDGNIKAQIGPHDMRLPIQYALAYPERPTIPLQHLPLQGTWDFFEPDHSRFPSLTLAYAAGRLGGTAPTVLNAADEVAVEAFLKEKIAFTHIPAILEAVLNQMPHNSALSWEGVQEADKEARALAKQLIS